MTAKSVNYLLILLTIVIFTSVVVIRVAYSPLNLPSVVGILLAVPSALLLVVARYQLGGSFSLTPQAKELVTRGLYSKIRHPIYVFGLVALLGLALMLESVNWIAVWAILLVLQLRRSRAEEKVLEAKFGEEWREYKKGTWF